MLQNVKSSLRPHNLHELFAINNRYNLSKKANNIWCSQAVTHPSTNQTQPGLTALIGREAVLSG